MYLKIIFQNKLYVFLIKKTWKKKLKTEHLKKQKKMKKIQWNKIIKKTQIILEKQKKIIKINENVKKKQFNRKGGKQK